MKDTLVKIEVNLSTITKGNADLLLCEALDYLEANNLLSKEAKKDYKKITEDILKQKEIPKNAFNL